MKRNRYIMERNGKPCYANKICAKKFRYQSYQNSIDKHDCTFMLPKKVTIATIRYINTYPKESIPRSQTSILIALWTDYEETALYPIT